MNVESFPYGFSNTQFPESGKGGYVVEKGFTFGWGATLPTGVSGYALGARFYKTDTGIWYLNTGTTTSAVWTLENAMPATTSYWSRFPAVSTVGSTGTGWSYAAAGIYISGPTDGVFAYFTIPIQLLPGTIITNIEIKAGGSDTHVKSTVELVKRVDSTIAATAWTSVATATQAAFGSAITVTQATPFTETVLETTSYALRVSATNDSGTPTTQVYSLGIQTSTRTP